MRRPGPVLQGAARSPRRRLRGVQRRVLFRTAFFAALRAGFFFAGALRAAAFFATLRTAFFAATLRTAFFATFFTAFFATFFFATFFAAFFFAGAFYFAAAATSSALERCMSMRCARA
jgi:hypothetical protein